jgi:putative membrane protein
MRFLLRLILNALAILLVAHLVSGVTVVSFVAAILGALVLAIVNALIRPVLFVLSLPVTILTLGLFTLVINALMFWLASRLSPGFYVAGFAAAFWGALVYSLISWAVSGLIQESRTN